jgi:hypothetical protein
MGAEMNYRGYSIEKAADGFSVYSLTNSMYD